MPRPIYTDPEIAGVGLTEAQARERYGDAVAVGVFPWVANARAVMSGATAGWVKSIHETTYGELLGLVIVGPHATDLIEAGVVAIDAESTVETVADGIAPHPTLSEAIKEAGLVALGRADPPSTRSAADARLGELPAQRRRDVDRLVVPEAADPQARHGRGGRLRRRRGPVVRPPAAQAAPASLARSLGGLVAGGAASSGGAASRAAATTGATGSPSRRTPPFPCRAADSDAGAGTRSRPVAT